MENEPDNFERPTRPWEATASLVCLFFTFGIPVLSLRQSTINILIILTFLSLGIVFAISALRQKKWRSISLYVIIFIYAFLVAGMIAAQYA